MKKSILSISARQLAVVGVCLSVALAGYFGWSSVKRSVDIDDRSGDVGERREADDPEGRENWFMYQRMYPFDRVPDNARKAAWDDAIARGLFADKFGNSAIWNSIGPTPTAGAGPGGNVSGRINEIAISPADAQIILVAGATGGIWRSTDGGANFTPVTDNQVDLSVGAIAFAPSDANTVYAGMGDRDNNYFGSGVLKSTDAGATWNRVNTSGLPEKGTTTRIAVDPANPNKVYLAQFYSLASPANCGDRGSCGVIGGIWISNDGGAAWTQSLEGIATDVAIHPTNAQIVYAALRLGAAAGPRGLFKSVDGGATWNIALASPYTASEDATKDFRVAVTPAAPDRVYAYFGSDGPPAEVRLEMSNDAGATWTTRGVVTNTAAGLDQGQFGYNTYLRADPSNADVVWVGCRDFFKSTDAGVTFTNLNGSFNPPYPNGPFTESAQKVHTDQQSFAFLPGNSSTFFVGNDGGIFKTTDGGNTFTSLNATLSLSQFVGFAIHPTDGTRSYAGAQDNGTQRRTPGTSNWVEFTATGDGGRLAINPVDRTIIFAGATNGTITRNMQEGTPNSQQDVASAASFGATGSPARIEFFAPVATNGVDARLYSGSWRLYICSDCATATGLGTWTLAGDTDLTKGGNDVLTSIAVSKSNNNVIYTGSRDGRAMFTPDNGANWNIIENGLPNRSITDIVVSATDPTLVYLTVSGYGSGHVFRSADSGTTWTNISNNLPDIPTSAFLIDPTNAATLYAGTDIGVFRSTDTGATWTAFNNGMPPVPVSRFASQATGRIQVATYGRGVYELSPANAGPTVSVGDANAQERPAGLGESDPLEFTITLSEKRNELVTIRVSTSGITATEGGDFQSVDDLEVTFPANTLTQTVTVPLIDDPGDEPDETMALDITDAGNAIVGDGEGIGTIVDDDPPATGVRSRIDFDGDGKTDVSVYRPNEGNWYLNQSTAGFSVLKWGLQTDILVPGDYDGDGKTDVAIFRANSDSAQPDYYILNSNGSTVSGVSWGLPGDIPVVGDYDGDGKTDVVVFRPSNGTWYILSSGDGSNTVEPFGMIGDIPLAIDNDGDGKTNLAVFRLSENNWYIARSTGTPATNFEQIPFGTAGDVLVPADYDGDGKDDVAVWRPSNGNWYIRRSSVGSVRIVQFGAPGDRPVPGDYDGDGKNDQAIYRDGVWWVNQSTSGVTVQNFGVATDAPIPAVLTRLQL